MVCPMTGLLPNHSQARHGHPPEPFYSLVRTNIIAAKSHTSGTQTHCRAFRLWGSSIVDVPAGRSGVSPVRVKVRLCRHDALRRQSACLRMLGEGAPCVVIVSHARGISADPVPSPGAGGAAAAARNVAANAVRFHVRERAADGDSAAVHGPASVGQRRLRVVAIVVEAEPGAFARICSVSPRALHVCNMCRQGDELMAGRQCCCLRPRICLLFLSLHRWQE